MIYFKNVSKIYPPHSVALENVTVSIEPNEFASLVGRSGAGKSTMVKLLIGEIRPTMGEVIVGDVSINTLAAEDMPYLRRRIGTVFQDFKLISSKTAYENVAFAMEAAGKSNKEIARDVPEVLEIVGLEDKAESFPAELSGGEKQRVAIGRALVHRPDVLVADEPTGNLDPENSWDVINLLTQINELGTTVILATHDDQVINALERRVIVLENGQIVRDDPKGKYSL